MYKETWYKETVPFTSAMAVEETGTMPPIKYFVVRGSTVETLLGNLRGLAHKFNERADQLEEQLREEAVGE